MEEIIYIIIIMVATIQIIMIVKFFEIASDIKEIRNIISKSLDKEEKRRGVFSIETLSEIPQKNNLPKISWYGWMYVAIIIIGIILYLINGPLK